MHFFYFADKGAFSQPAAEIFPASVPWRCRRCATPTIDATPMQSSCAGSPDGGADNQGSSSQVSFFSTLLLNYRIKTHDRSEIVPFPLCRSQQPPESDLQQHLLKELEVHYRTAKADMMLAAKSKPIHGKKWRNCSISCNFKSIFLTLLFPSVNVW